MKLLRAGFAMLALLPADLSPSMAADGASPTARDGVCDVLCDMQAYFNRDHMVTLVPAGRETPHAGLKPAGRRPKAPSSVMAQQGNPRETAARRPAARRPRTAFAALSHPARPASTEAEAPARAQASPPASASAIPSEVSQALAVIPGGVPLVAAQFSPPAGAAAIP